MTQPKLLSEKLKLNQLKFSLTKKGISNQSSINRVRGIFFSFRWIRKKKNFFSFVPAIN